MNPCKREDIDLVSLNQELLLGKNPKRKLKKKYKNVRNIDQTGYEKNNGKVEAQLTSENVIRKHNKNRLDFTTKAINPIVYNNFNGDGITEFDVERDHTLEKSDGIERNIARDNMFEGYQSEKQEFNAHIPKTSHENEALIQPNHQKYVIAQVRNYLPFVKDSNVQEKLHTFLKYLHNSSTAKELSINNKGNVQRGLFDTQTKFSEYLNYYTLNSEEKRHVKKPPFYDVIIENPFQDYLEMSHPSAYNSKSSDANMINSENHHSGVNIAPLRDIKDADLRLQTSLPKMMNFLTNLNVDMTSHIDEFNYESMINIIAFPIYATNTQYPSSGTFNAKTKEYKEFVNDLKVFLANDSQRNPEDNRLL